MATIGIDLGTTFSCVAAFITDKIEIIPNGVGNNTTPSVVAFVDEGEIIVGETAVSEGIEEPRNTIFDIKRLIGKRFNDPKIKEYSKIWPFQVTEQNKEMVVVVDERIYSAKFVCTQILLYLKEYAEIFLNAEVTKAVVTVPAYFTESQKSITTDACIDAGLEILQLITEPTAAAISYYCKLGKIEGEKTCLIFDLGGGTLDLAVVTYKDKHIKILKIGGDPNLGGEDFDSEMVKYCIEEFKKKHGIDLRRPQFSSTDVDPEKVARNLRRLKIECQKQKCFLSSGRRVVAGLEAIHGELDLVVPITRDRFEELNESKFQKCLTLVQQLLEECELRKEDIDDIVLVGGSTRIPRVQQLLTEYFGKRLTKNLNADEAVAFGAAMQAHFLVNGDSTEAATFSPGIEHLDIPMSEKLLGELNDVKVKHDHEMESLREELTESKVTLHHENETLRKELSMERDKSSNLALSVTILEGSMKRLFDRLEKKIPIPIQNIPADLLSFKNTEKYALAVVINNSTSTHFAHPKKWNYRKDAREYFPLPPAGILPFSPHGFGFTCKPFYSSNGLLGLFSFQIDATRFVATYGVWSDLNSLGLAFLPPDYPIDYNLLVEIRDGVIDWSKSPEKSKVYVGRENKWFRLNNKMEARLEFGTFHAEATMTIREKSILNINIKQIGK